MMPITEELEKAIQALIDERDVIIQQQKALMKQREIIDERFAEVTTNIAVLQAIYRCRKLGRETDNGKPNTDTTTDRSTATGEDRRP